MARAGREISAAWRASASHRDSAVSGGSENAEGDDRGPVAPVVDEGGRRAAVVAHARAALLANRQRPAAVRRHVDEVLDLDRDVAGVAPAAVGRTGIVEVALV